MINAGIISKHEESDKYLIKEEVKSGILGFYIRIGYRIVPRFSFYLGIFICGFIGFFLLALLWIQKKPLGFTDRTVGDISFIMFTIF
jgi:hypothetical protein